MEKPDRSEKDDAQKAKLIFLSLAVAVIIILIWSFVSASNARKERDAARQETEMLKMDNAKLEQLLKDQNQLIDDLKKKMQLCEARKVKAKPAAKKSSKSAAKKSSKAKKSK